MDREMSRFIVANSLLLISFASARQPVCQSDARALQLKGEVVVGSKHSQVQRQFVTKQNNGQPAL